jgi:murein DD-endopeptidase MepM/ murein hydrolase activator NlpD
MGHPLCNSRLCNPDGNGQTMSTPFTRHFITINRLHEHGFSTWLFYPGMFFGDRNKWWGDSGKRSAPHEGVDLCFYRTNTGGQLRLDPASHIPAVAGGKVMCIIDDFLGKSIFIAHADPTASSYHTCAIYGHTRPLPGLAAGSSVGSGEVIASLSGNGRPGGPGPHLHVSLALISDSLPPERITWARLRDPRLAVFLDPMGFIICAGNSAKNTVGRLSVHVDGTHQHHRHDH